VTREEFLAGMAGLGTVECRPQPNGQLLAVLEPQAIPGTSRKSRVAFSLPDPVGVRPQVYVDADLRTRTGGMPNNWTTTLIDNDIFGTWSFSCPWDPASDTPETLVLAVLGQWDR
jgi:hypothetical protein